MNNNFCKMIRSAARSHQITSVPAVLNASQSSPSGLVFFLHLIKKFFPIYSIFFICACSNPTQPKTTIDTNSIKHQTSNINNQTSARTAIDTSGYYIDLPPTHRIEKQHGADFNVYYFTPNDTIQHPGEAGLYMGPKPDANPPSSNYTLNEIDGEILGENHKWMEYVTQYYTQRETFIDLGNGNFIHAWCYSNDPDELERLFKMISTISK